LPTGGWVIDDSYNANPESAIAAIDVLARRSHRRILILGDMAELGSQAPLMHRQVGEHAVRSGIEDLLSMGTLSRHASEIFGGKHFDTFEELIVYLEALDNTEQVTFLVKGSRSSAMERVAEYLDGRGQ
jgi:UDP-N-acetylmuramoyl-tripeptide--D-alanyl-D-alanine ligase